MPPHWRKIYQAIETITPHEVLACALSAEHLDVTGVFVNGIGFNFEKIANYTFVQESANVLYALHGLAVSCATGVVHPYLTQYARATWVCDLFNVRLFGDPAFVFVCKHKILAIATWMVQIMQEVGNIEPMRLRSRRGNGALHYAVENRQWEWARWLVKQGCSPFDRNEDGNTPIMLTAPFHDKLDIFECGRDQRWYSALHEALVVGRAHVQWCCALLDRGADVNQPELYDSPIECLSVFAEAGLDMNFETDVVLTAAQHRILFSYGRVPACWSDVLEAFAENEWVRFFHRFHVLKENTDTPAEFVRNVGRNRCVTAQSLQVRQRALNGRLSGQTNPELNVQTPKLPTGSVTAQCDGPTKSFE